MRTPLSASVVRALRALPQYTRMSRHAMSILQHSTPRKLWNLALVEAELRLRRTRVRGRPYVLIVDPTNVCNLRCPLCPTGTNDGGRRGQMMPWETFTKVIDELAPWAYEVNLHNWGESTLHPHVFEMIEYASKRNLATNMSSNFNIPEKHLAPLIDSGLEYLILSIDGASPDTYAKYRVRGDFDVVIDNARRLLSLRAERGSKTPFVEWQFIVFRHNAHEVEAARALAEEIGVDRFRIIPPGLPFDGDDHEGMKKEWFVPRSPDETAGEAEDFRGQVDASCFYLYRSMTTNPDGKVAPCCIVYGENNDFGDWHQQSFLDIWNNSKYQSARSQFRNGGVVTDPTVCDRCDMFKKRSVRQEPNGGSRPA